METGRIEMANAN
jgi:hypothetical protein